MGLEEKVRNAKKNTWITDGIPKWKVKLLIFKAKAEVKMRKLLIKWRENR